MELSKTAQELLVSPRFTPCSGGYLVPSVVSDQLDCAEEEAESYLLELELAGFLRRPDGKSPTLPPGLHFQTTIEGWYASEKLKRELRRRHPALLDQRRHRLDDLILAIAFVPHTPVVLTAVTFGPDTQIPLLSIFVRLGQWSKEDIRKLCEKLVDGRLLQFEQRRDGNRDLDTVELTIRGKKRYNEEVRQRLHLAEGKNILEPPAGTLKLFFAWQSEIKPARNALSEIVPGLVERVNKREDLLRPLELVEATERGEGALRIDVALEEKIRAADYFIGDLTPVYAYEERLRVNENVLVEVGFALASKPADHIVLVEMQDAPYKSDGSKNPQPAFDIGHVRRLKFRDKQDGMSRLHSELETMLKRDRWFAGSDE